MPVAAAENIEPVKVVQLQKSTLSPKTNPDAANPQASTASPPNPIKNDAVVVVGVTVIVGVMVGVTVEVGVCETHGDIEPT